MKFDHIGVPTQDEHEWSSHLEGAKLHITDYSKDKFRVEWLKFADGSPMPKELQEKAHIAFEVDDLDAELVGKNILIPPFEPFPGLRCAFILHHGLAVEFMQKM